MNVETITMDPEQAKAKLKAYRAERHKDAEEVCRAAEKGYEALASGTPLLNLDEVIAAGGFFEGMLPKIAVGRADRKEVCFTWRGHEEIAKFYSGSERVSEWDSLRVDVNLGRLHNQFYRTATGANTTSKTVMGYTLIPMVPADVRPATGQLKDWHILWEVEQWTDRPRTAKAPRDPYLIKHVGGSLWAVLAEWDLTELERAVMTQIIRR